MVDPNVLLRAWLLAASSVTSLLGTNANGSIYCGDLPEKFDPKLGAGIQIFVTGGTPHPEITSVIDARMQVRVWAGAEQYVLARQVFRAIFDLIHGATQVDFGAFGRVIRCQAETPGRDVTDPDDGSATVLGFFLLQVTDGSGPTIFTPAPQGLILDGGSF